MAYNDEIMIIFWVSQFQANPCWVNVCCCTNGRMFHTWNFVGIRRVILCQSAKLSPYWYPVDTCHDSSPAWNTGDIKLVLFPSACHDNPSIPMLKLPLLTGLEVMEIFRWWPSPFGSAPCCVRKKNDGGGSAEGRFSGIFVGVKVPHQIC